MKNTVQWKNNRLCMQLQIDRSLHNYFWILCNFHINHWFNRLTICHSSVHTMDALTWRKHINNRPKIQMSIINIIPKGKWNENEWKTYHHRDYLCFFFSLARARSLIAQIKCAIELTRNYRNGARIDFIKWYLLCTSTVDVECMLRPHDARHTLIHVIIWRINSNADIFIKSIHA